jgi:hypothetical protein
MTAIDPGDVEQRRASVPRRLPLFDAELQERRVTEFLSDLLETRRSPTRR